MAQTRQDKAALSVLMSCAVWTVWPGTRGDATASAVPIHMEGSAARGHLPPGHAHRVLWEQLRHHWPRRPGGQAGQVPGVDWSCEALSPESHRTVVLNNVSRAA